jgi:CRISPR-associated protein Cmr4
MVAKAFFWQALTPVHPGTGQDSSSVIDLPVAREAATGFPVIPASSLKGVLRDGRSDEAANKIFGSLDQMGELTLTDARLLLLPVRSYVGTFALITCPLVLQRLERDAEALGRPFNLPLSNVAGEQALAGSAIQYEQKVILEDIDLKVAGPSDTLARAISQMAFGREEPYLLERFALVSNDVFSYFCQTGLEVIARVQLDHKQKTVKEGPWYEEAIPAETVFSCFAIAKDPQHFSELEKSRYLQIGGQASVGRGLLRRLGVSHG